MLDVTIRSPVVELIADPPLLHPSGTAQWSLRSEALEFIAQNVAAGQQTLETGCGVSTILFALLGCEHICITPLDDEIGRVREYCRSHSISLQRVQFVNAYSQDVLPALHPTNLSLVLIDGGHGFPAPFIDWIYTCQGLNIGGHVIVDDTDIWTGEILRDFLRAEWQWQAVAELGKTAIFRKITMDVIKDWGAQPYVTARSFLARDWPWVHGTARGHILALGKLLDQLAPGTATDIDAAKAKELADDVAALVVKAQDAERRLRNLSVPEIYSYDGLRQLAPAIMSQAAPWLALEPPALDGPCMISYEEKQYYAYIGAFYRGFGRAIELGPWLGSSTRHIVASLDQNPRFADQRLFVFDDFVWRKSWMDNYVAEDQILPNHASFQHLFEAYTADIVGRLSVQRAKTVDYDGNEALPLLQWPGDPIEIAFVDCGRTFEANQAWYAALRHCFIQRQTLIIMRDWRLHREVPQKWFNQTLQFTQSKQDELTLLHEVSDGGLATFLFTG